MIKKVFLISSISFLILGLAFLFLKFFSKGNFVFFNKNQPEKINVSEKENPSLKEEVVVEKNKEKIKQVIAGNLISATIKFPENNIYYFHNNNFLKFNSSTTSPVSLASHPFKEINYINWSFQRDKALIKDGQKFYIAFLEENKISPIEKAIDTAVFNHYGDKLVFKDYNKETQKRSIKLLDLNTNKEKLLANTKERRVSLKMSPLQNEFLFFAYPSAFQKTNSFLFDLVAEEEKQVLENKQGVNFLWSTKGDKLLFSYTLESDKSKMELAIMNKNGGETRSLNFPALVDKCAWSKDNVNIYCAGLTDIEATTVLPDDWLKGNFKNKDVFWKINTNNGEKKRILELKDIKKNYDGYNFFVDQEEENLFFINKQDKDLYKIVL